MNKYYFLIPILLILGYILFYVAEGGLKNTKPSPTSSIQVIQPSPPQLNEAVDFKASFLIITNGTKRIFTDPKYHNKSKDVFITAENPSIVNVKKSGITWADFFATLPSPMKVEKTCLYTGTGQTFCNSDTQNLKFFINGQIDSDALTKEIKNGDELLISFGPIKDPNIDSQLKSFN